MACRRPYRHGAAGGTGSEPRCDVPGQSACASGGGVTEAGGQIARRRGEARPAGALGARIDRASGKACDIRQSAGRGPAHAGCALRPDHGAGADGG
jgi:hypothetical protein